MPSQDLFEKNCALWARIFPEDAVKICNQSGTNVLFCQSANGLPNLKYVDQEISYFYHSESDPLKEAQEWFRTLPLKGVSVLYVYGIGLGYIYEAALPWLKDEDDRSIVFIEDQSQVIRCFFETERASQFLADPQAQLCYFEESQESWYALSVHLEMFSIYPFAVHSSPTYLKQFQLKAETNKAMFSFMATFNQQHMAEYNGNRQIVLKNFYDNILRIENSYMASGLLDKFKGVPAIICGAGPSLDKNIDLLKTLGDRALIFAGGTGINAAEGGNVTPHLCVGIDPNMAQKTRMIMSKSYEIPFIYRSRMNSEALDMIHGDHLLIPGLIGYALPAWIGEKLGIETVPFDDGLNVLNFSLTLAYYFGCNPIICVGIDLAYSGDASYASNIVNHPLHERNKHFKTKQYQDDLVTKLDINKKPIKTLWKWIGESLWYGGVAERFPGINLMNATEGGIGFPGIPNMTLAEVKEKFLTKTFDLSTWLQGEIYQSLPPKSANAEEVKNVLGSLAVSLKILAGICQEIVVELSKTNHANLTFVEGLVGKMKNEEGYKGFLVTYEEAYRKMFLLETLRLKWYKEKYSEEEIKNRKIALDLNHYTLLQRVAQTNAEMIEDSLFQFNDTAHHQAAWINEEGIKIQEKLKKQYPIFKFSDEEYSFQDGLLKMVDRELNLNVTMPFSPDDFLIINYPSGSVKLQQYYLKGELHGPSSFYHPDGTLMAQSWFNLGKRVGKVVSYYETGELHSLQRFEDGHEQGMQEYFFPGGLPRSRLPYDQGLLHGDILLFTRMGQLSRHLQFEHGYRQGMEKSWDNLGRLRVESYYCKNRPVSIAREWYANGKLAAEMVYDKDSNLIEKTFFDLVGNRLVESPSKDDLYFDQMNQDLHNLTASLENVVRDLNVISPKVSAPIDLEAEMKHLQEELVKMHQLGSQMEELLKSDPGTESVWKNLSFQREMEVKTLDQGKQLSEELAKIETNMAELMKQLNPPPQDKQDK